jgi:FMN phosphatase YigB (HAD superfamily)
MDYIFDVDGVLLNFLPKFQEYMKKEKNTLSKIEHSEEYDFNLKNMYPHLNKDEIYNLILEMNQNKKYFPFLKPIYGAKKALATIQSIPGARLHAVTSAGHAKITEKMRIQNLKKIGFKGNIQVLPLGGCKKEALSMFPKGSWFIDDLPKNIDVGIECGLKGILFDALHNRKSHSDYTVAHNWNDCLKIMNINQ